MRKLVDKFFNASSANSFHFKPDRLRNSLLSQATAQVIKLLVGIAVSGFTARYLGPERLGLLAYVTALSGLLAPIGSLGVKGSLSVMLCDQQPKHGLLGSAFLVEFLGTVAISIVLIPFAWFAREPVIGGLILLAILENLLNWRSSRSCASQRSAWGKSI